MSKLKGKKKVLQKLRNYSLIFGTLLFLSVVGNYFSFKALITDKTKTLYTLCSLQNMIEDLQNINSKSINVLNEANKLISQKREELRTDYLAGLIIEYMIDRNIVVNYFDCVNIIKCSKKYIFEPFSYKDMLAIAFIESNFKANEIGKLDEKGTWQILDWTNELKIVDGKDPFDIETNCKMAISVLKSKHKQRKNYKDSIIGYNGWVVRNGKVSTKYYDNFMKRRKIIEKWCKKTDKRYKYE